MRPADEEHRVRAAVHADRHPQHDVARAGADPARSARSVRRIATPTQHARIACSWSASGRRHTSTSASPPNFSSEPPSPYASASSVEKHALIMSTSCSAPSRPRAREPLGEPREAGHVDEHHRAVDGLGQHFDRARQPG